VSLRTVEALIEAGRAGAPPSFYFFWGHRAREGESVGKWCLSQWWPAPFEVDGARYRTAEHFMMAEKARLFGDGGTAARILAVDDPSKAKGLGRKVRGFDEAVWSARRYEIVVRGNLAKFGQNPALSAFLTGVREDVFVEASPVDAIWGIGLAEKDLDARDPARWCGLNLLGFALTEVRERLRNRA
jgi:ribA/ribD-fused uncharacterized protein